MSPFLSLILQVILPLPSTVSLTLIFARRSLLCPSPEGGPTAPAPGMAEATSTTDPAPADLAPADPAAPAARRAPTTIPPSGPLAPFHLGHTLEPGNNSEKSDECFRLIGFTRLPPSVRLFLWLFGRRPGGSGRRANVAWNRRCLLMTQPRACACVDTHRAVHNKTLGEKAKHRVDIRPFGAFFRQCF